MKKNYAKMFVSAALAVAAVFGVQAQDVVLEENFDKLEALTDAGVHKYGKNPWTGKDAEGVEYQPNFTNIQKDGNLDDLNGWSSRTTYLYACQGFVRISKTNYGGDLLSPKFAALTEPTDVDLTWQGIGYTSNVALNEDGSYKSGGVHDYQYYLVGVMGGGELVADNVLHNVQYMDDAKNDIFIDCAVINIPTDCFITMDTLQAWSFEGTKNKVTIKKATANTQVVFMSTIPAVKTTDYSTPEMPIAEDAPHGVNVKVNRVVLDNIKVVKAGSSAVNDINVAKEVKARKVMENGQIYIIAGDKKYNVMGAEVK